MSHRLHELVHPADVMKADLFSEILLVGAGMAMAVAFAVVLLATVLSWALAT